MNSSACAPFCCTLCPRACRADRRSAASPGRCGGGPMPRVARAAPHHWEEPCISGSRGSGTVFFAGCALGCVFCQNHEISRGGAGQPMDCEALADAFLALQAQGVHNLNLVTAGHYRPWVLQALQLARRQGFALPVVWNTGGYESLQAISALCGAVDIWLFDWKFFSPALAEQLAHAPDYFEVAHAALNAALNAAGPPRTNGEGLLQSGVVLRILVLPGYHKDAIRLLHAAAELQAQRVILSLMSQYTPPPNALANALPKPLRRRVSSYEYNAVADVARQLGFTGYFQKRSSASVSYTPPFGQTGQTS